MSGLTAVKNGILLVFFIGAAWADMREMRIPNRLLGLAWLLRIPVFLAEILPQRIDFLFFEMPQVKRIAHQPARLSE